MAQKSAAQKKTRIVVMASTYFGASWLRKKNGPAIFPAANMIKRSVFVNARLVWPAIFCPTIVRQNGHYVVESAMNKIDYGLINKVKTNRDSI